MQKSEHASVSTPLNGATNAKVMKKGKPCKSFVVLHLLVMQLQLLCMDSTDQKWIYADDNMMAHEVQKGGQGRITNAICTYWWLLFSTYSMLVFAEQ